MISIRRLPAAVVVALALAACASSPPVRYYAFAAPAVPAPERAAYSVVVERIRVPDLIDRPQMVLRVAPNRIVVAEQSRWAEPLGASIGRALEGHLASALPAARVANLPAGPAGTRDYHVLVDLQGLEFEPGKRTTLDLAWSIRLLPGDDEVASGRRHAEEALVGTDPAEMVAAQERLLRAVADEMATALRGVEAKRPAK